MVVAAIVALLVVFIRGSFDAGEPIEQAIALVALVLLVERWQRERSAHQLIRAGGAQHSRLIPQASGQLQPDR
jgi:hypothetical protein